MMILPPSGRIELEAHGTKYNTIACACCNFSRVSLQAASAVCLYDQHKISQEAQRERAFFWSLRGIFVCAVARKNDEFSAWSGDLLDVEDVLLGSSEYCQSYGVGQLLLHCNASNLVLDILKHDKIWGGAIWVSLQLLPWLLSKGN